MLSSGRVQQRDRLAGEGEKGVNGEADRKGCSHEFWMFLLAGKPKGGLMAQIELLCKELSLEKMTTHYCYRIV